jgi:hypothetical protein
VLAELATSLEQLLELPMHGYEMTRAGNDVRARSLLRSETPVDRFTARCGE